MLRLVVASPRIRHHDFQVVDRTYQEQHYQLSLREVLFRKYVGSDYAPPADGDD